MNHESHSVPLLDTKHYNTPSVFTPENMLREARRQKQLPEGRVPALCVLDPDGDFVDYMRETGQAQIHTTWACYHTTLNIVSDGEIEFGVIGRAVGAPFAVLVAEELFACGCELLISITSAGQLVEVDEPPYVVLIERALRDEGTSYHYLPPAPYSHLHRALYELVCSRWNQHALPLHVGASWTTDAPFRETSASIALRREQGHLTVEMEAAALYALAEARNYPIICFAHVTNQMAQNEGDFEKGAANGSIAMMEIIRQVAHMWQPEERETSINLKTALTEQV